MLCVQGQATDIAIQAEEILTLKRQINSIYAKHTGQPLKRIGRFAQLLGDNRRLGLSIDSTHTHLPATCQNRILHSIHLILWSAALHWPIEWQLNMSHRREDRISSGPQ